MGKLKTVYFILFLLVSISLATISFSAPGDPLPPFLCQMGSITSSTCGGEVSCDNICGVQKGSLNPVLCDPVKSGLIQSIYGNNDKYLFDALCLKKQTSYRWYECNADNIGEKKGGGITSPVGINQDNPQFLCASYGAFTAVQSEKWIQCGGKLVAKEQSFNDGPLKNLKNRGLLVPVDHYYGKYYCQKYYGIMDYPGIWEVIPQPVLIEELKIALPLKGDNVFKFKYNTCSYSLRVDAKATGLKLNELVTYTNLHPQVPGSTYFELQASESTFFPAKINVLVDPPLTTPDSPVVQLVISAPAPASDPCPSSVLPLVEIPAVVIAGLGIEGDLDGSGAVNQFDVKWIIENPQKMWTEKLNSNLQNLNKLIKAMSNNWS